MYQFKEFAINIAAAALGNSGKEVVFRSLVATSGIAASNWMGGWDGALKFLLIAMVVDYITGLLGAIKNKNLDSDIMFWGGVRKATVLFVIGLCDILDGWIQNGAPIFRTAAVYFYAGREGLSVAENLGKLNVPLPEKLKSFLKQLNESEKDEDKGMGE